nr:LLM class flavin-dependent oxidoreductase [Streptomyces sp. NBC_00830]
MELSLPLNCAGDPREACDQVAALEPAGLDAVRVAEAYGFDSPTLMGCLAARTERMKIGAAILNVYSQEAEAAVPDEFCELMSLCGPEGYVRERIEASRESGVTMLNAIPVGPDPARLISTVKNWL